MSATRPAPIKLSELLRRDVAADPMITGVTADSRKVAPGSLFVALPGSAADGRAFIPQALSQGAAAVLAPADTDARVAPVLITSGELAKSLRAWMETGSLDMDALNSRVGMSVTKTWLVRRSASTLPRADKMRMPPGALAPAPDPVRLRATSAARA